jgi:hypothetical protein
MRMTNGQRMTVKLTQFAEILRLSSHLDHPKKLHTGRVMHTREMTPMYDPNSDFHAPKIEGILPHFAILHRMRRRMLVPMIGDSDAIPAYERNLLDVVMKNEHFDAFDYIIDEIWNIAINPQRSCGFTPYIIYMIEVAAYEKFYKDAAHEPLHPVVPKGPARHHISPPLDVAPTCSGRYGGASYSSSSISGFIKMFRGIFAMCCRTDQCMDVMEHRLDIVRHNQDLIHYQWDEPHIEFRDEPVYPPVPDPYASLTPAELAAYGIGPTRAPAGNDDNDNGDEEAANDDDETEHDE